MLPFRIDDIIFGISAASVGTVLALTHGGTEPLMRPTPEVGADAATHAAAIVADPPAPASVVEVAPATPPEIAPSDEIRAVAPLEDGPRLPEADHEREDEEFDD